MNLIPINLKTNSNRKIEAIKLFLFLLLLPPIFSLILSTVKLFEKRGSTNVLIFSFSFFYALFLTYLTPHYDTIQRFWDFSGQNDQISLDFDPLSILASFLIHNLSIQSFHLFFLFYFTIILLNARSFLENKILSSFSILIAITIIYFRNIGDITYYTLAVSICLYFASKNVIQIWRLVILILVVYLIHPGLLLILLPAIVLFYLLKRKYYKLSIIYLIIFFVLTYRVFTITEPIGGVSNEFINQFISLFNSYVASDGQWGRRTNLSNLSEGLRLNIFTSIVKILMLFVCYTLFRFRKQIENMFVLSIYIISLILYFTANGLYTINERVIVTNVILGAYLLVPILEQYKNQALKKTYGVLVVVIFFFSLNIYNPPRDVIFYDTNSSYEITTRAFYVPSFALIFYDNMGYSDEYLRKNAKYNPVYNPKDKYE
jgi:hypothetical protein